VADDETPTPLGVRIAVTANADVLRPSPMVNQLARAMWRGDEVDGVSLAPFRELSQWRGRRRLIDDVLFALLKLDLIDRERATALLEDHFTKETP
jgi:hypothetical protein